MHMSSHENIRSSDLELTLMRSDLIELFQIHADKTILRQSDDLEQPIEIMLSGTYPLMLNGYATDVDVHVRQRIDQHGIDYIIITGQENDYYWCQITDQEATSVATQKPMDDRDIAAIRQLISRDKTAWSEDDSRKWRYTGSPYEVTDLYRKKL